MDKKEAITQAKQSSSAASKVFQGDASKVQVARAMCQLLGQFANPSHDALKRKPFAGKVWGDTGVMYDLYIRSDQPSMIGLALMVTINKSTPNEHSKMVRIHFDMEKLAKDHAEYVKGTVLQLMKAIDAFIDHDKQHNKSFVADLLDHNEKLMYGASGSDTRS